MKKLFAILFLLLFSFSIFAYGYPQTLLELLLQFQQEKTQLLITTVDGTNNHGKILLVQDDYILFEVSYGPVVLTIHSIVEIARE